PRAGHRGLLIVGVILPETPREAGPAGAGASGGGMRCAGAERLRALAAIEHAVAREAVPVAGEEVGHLLLPGVDEAHPLVIGHPAHLEKQPDVLARLMVDPEELE